MNTQSYLDSQPSHISTGPSYGPPSTSTGGMSQYQYQPQASMQNGQGSYTPTHPSYSNYYGTGVTSPQAVSQPVSAPINTQLAPIPAMPIGQQPHGHYGGSAGSGGPYQNFDQTGQVAPPGVKPRVTATLWEDEGSLCFQVEAKGVCVARREDNHFINGTKLLNVAGMTRGRRDGILKSEKTRHVVKIGPMHLKGVWIPFDRALDFANREKITELLYPLFVHNIGALLYHPTNSSRTNMVMEAAQAKRRNTMDGKQPGGMMGNPSQQPGGLLHHHSLGGQMSSQLSSTPHSIAPHPNSGRPALDRAHTFPTPPTSASSLIGNSGSSYGWNDPNVNQSVQNPQPLAIDTGLSNTRSMPSTPATTPPASVHGISGYQNQQSYDSSRPMYSAAPQSQGQYTTQPQNMARFGQSMPGAYIKNDMGPPSRAPGETEHSEIKQDPYSQGQGSDQVGHANGEDEADHEQEGEYQQDTNATYNAPRGSYSYGATQSIGSIHGEHAHISQDQVNSSPHQNGSGRVTPRASVPQSQWPGFNTPPRSGGTSSTLYNVMADSRGSLANGHSVSDAYGSSYPVNGNPNKRGRDEDDDYKNADIEGLKRRKSGREGSISAPIPAYTPAQNSTIIRSSRR